MLPSLQKTTIMDHWIVFFLLISPCTSKNLPSEVSIVHLAHHVQALDIFPRALWTDVDVLETYTILTLDEDSFTLPIYLKGGKIRNISELRDAGLAVLSSCKHVEEVELIVSHHIPVLIFEECEVLQMKHWPMNLESRIFTIDRSWRVTEIYKIDLASDKVIVQDIGTYDLKRGFALYQPLIWFRRQNLNGYSFRIGHHQESRPLFVIGSEGSYQGYLGDIVQQLKNTLNFSSILVPNLSNRYGALKNSTAFDGLVGMIQEGKVDMGVADISATQERLEAIDVLEPCWVTSYKLLLKRPRDTIQWTTYVRGYSAMFWMTYFLTVALLMAVSFAFARHWKVPRDQILGHFFGVILNREITTLDAKTLQPSFRIFSFSMLTFSFIVFATYSAVLTSFLATREISIPVKNVADLLKPEVKFALKAGTATYDMFRNAKEGSLFKQIYDTKIKSDKLAVFEGGSITYSDMESNRTRLLNMGYYIVLDPIFQALVNEDPCQYIFAPFEKFLIDFSSFGFTKDSPFKNLFNFHLRKQRDAGLWQTFQQRMSIGRSNLPEIGDCNEKDADDDIGLKLDVTIPVFFVFASGILVSFGISIVERLYSMMI